MKFKFRPAKKVSDFYSAWYAWYPVKVSYNEIAWREIVYRRQIWSGPGQRETEHISKEEYFTRAMKYDEEKKEYDGMQTKASNQIYGSNVKIIP